MVNLISTDVGVDVSQCFERPAIAKTYAIAGRFISIESTDTGLRDLFHRYFSAWHARSIPADRVQPHASILIRTDAPPDPPANLIPFELPEGGICYTDAATYFFEKTGSVVRAGHDNSSQVELWVGGHEAACEPTTLARLLFHAAVVAMRRVGLYELHAAGVVSPAGAGYLVIGPSGSGKSALATRLASAGWQYSSDDVLLLCESGDRIEAHGLRRVFALTKHTLSATKALDLTGIDTQVEAFDPRKVRFDPAEIFPDQFVESCVPTTLLFSRVTNEPKTSARLLSPSETMGRLLEMCPWACCDKSVADQHLKVLANLARQARGFEFLAGEDLLNESDFASRFLTAALR